MIGASAAFLAWLGASMIVLADGRRGLAVGLALATAGLAGIAWVDGGEIAAAIVLAGGAVAAFQRHRVGPTGWLVMAPGSTPRLILCVTGGLVALWFAASVTVGPDGATRFAVLSVVGLGGARIVSSREPSVIVTAVAALAIAIAVAALLGVASPGPAPYLAAALIAAGVMFLPLPAARAS